MFAPYRPRGLYKSPWRPSPTAWPICRLPWENQVMSHIGDSFLPRPDWSVVKASMWMRKISSAKKSDKNVKMQRRIRETGKIPRMNQRNGLPGSLFTPIETRLPRTQPVVLFDEKNISVSKRFRSNKIKIHDLHSCKINSVSGSSRSWMQKLALFFSIYRFNSTWRRFFN